MISFSSFSKRPGATLAGIFGLAFSSVVLLCGAGLTPTVDVQRSDINANGHSLTTAATVNAANLIATSAVTTATLTVTGRASLPGGTTFGGAALGRAAGQASSGFAPATTGTQVLAGNGSGGLTNLNLSGATITSGTLVVSGGGGGGVSALGPNLSPLATITSGTLDLSQAPNTANCLVALNLSGQIAFVDGGRPIPMGTLGACGLRGL